MSTLDTIFSRRSIKHFDPDHQMPQSDYDQLIQAAISAPTSFNIQHWRFVRITDPKIRTALRQAAWDQAQVTDASELMIITGNIQAWSQKPDRYWRNTDDNKRQALVGMLTEFYQDREWLQRDEAIRSGAMAAQNLILAAKSMGYDSCPMIGFDFDKAAELIQLPQDHVIVMMLTIGKAIAEAWPRGGQLSLEEILIDNRFREE